MRGIVPIRTPASLEPGSSSRGRKSRVARPADVKAADCCFIWRYAYFVSSQTMIVAEHLDPSDNRFCLCLFMQCSTNGSGPLNTEWSQIIDFNSLQDTLGELAFCPLPSFCGTKKLVPNSSGPRG